MKKYIILLVMAALTSMTYGQDTSFNKSLADSTMQLHAWYGPAALMLVKPIHQTIAKKNH
jgi:hypothetical protein